MDIFSHALWSMAGYTVVAKKKQKNFKLFWIAFWGMFPDLFAFTIPTIAVFIQTLTGHFDWTKMPKGAASLADNAQELFDLSYSLYNISHSIPIFLFLFFTIYFWRKWKSKKHIVFGKIKPFWVWEMGAWLFHILIDIPTHSIRLFPTPFLWPFSDFKIDGFPWAQRWFMIINCSLLFLTYFFLYWNKIKRKFHKYHHSEKINS